MTAPRLTTSVFRVPTDGPEADGTATWEATTVVVVEAELDGLVGLGWSYTSAAAAIVVEELLGPALGAHDSADPAISSSVLARAVRNVGRTGIAAAAVSAVDIALWDLSARRLGVALSSLLGRRRDRVALYGSGGFTNYTDDRTQAQLEGWRAAGMRAVKIKIGEGRGTRPDRDRDRVALARRVIGDDVDLFVDANGAYGFDDAVRMEEAMRVHRVSWFEEPVTSDRPRALAAVRSRADAAIAAGEYVWRPSDAAVLLDAGAVDCLQVDVTRCGGITCWREIAELAGRHGIPLSAHCAPQLSAHVGVATEGMLHLEWFHDHARLEPELFDGTLPPRGGALEPRGEVAGHGMALSPRAERFRIRMPSPAGADR